MAQEAKASSGIIANTNQKYSGPPRGGLLFAPIMSQCMSTLLAQSGHANRAIMKLNCLTMTISQSREFRIDGISVFHASIGYVFVVLTDNETTPPENSIKQEH